MASTQKTFLAPPAMGGGMGGRAALGQSLTPRVTQPLLSALCTGFQGHPAAMFLPA